MADQLLSVANLSVERGGRLVLSCLSFTLAAGEILLVCGRNGSGKSTLLRTIAGLLQPAAGRIHFASANEEVRGVETVHYLGYDDALKQSLTVRENLQFWAAMLGDRHSGAPEATLRWPLQHARHAEAPGQLRPEPASRISPDRAHAPISHPRFTASGMTIMDALAAFGIARLIDLPAGYLSAGQKRRVALARLLLAHRPIWLLDEPLIALDAETQETAAAVMAAHSVAGGAILLASHQPLAIEARQIDLDALAASRGDTSGDIAAAPWPAGLA